MSFAPLVKPRSPRKSSPTTRSGRESKTIPQLGVKRLVSSAGLNERTHTTLNSAVTHAATRSTPGR
jgi:hypothetical protein